MTGDARILHESGGRLRLRLPPATDGTALQGFLRALAGVRSVRLARAARSLTVTHDGRAATRRAILARLDKSHRGLEADVLPSRRGETLPLEAPLLAAALAPILPPAGRAAAAVGLVALRALGAWRQRADLTAVALDSVSLATTALTGHPLTATTSLALSTLAERQRNAMLADMDHLLSSLAAPARGRVPAERGGVRQLIAAAALQPGDCLPLETGGRVPVDALVTAGAATVMDGLPGCGARTVRAGARVWAGEEVVEGSVELQVERVLERSRSARLQDHVRHVLRTRDVPGALTPDLERLVALPMTAAGLVLALTGDAARTAAMLQADPQTGLALANPLAREAALAGLAHSGALLSGLDALERLAAATTFAFEDVGVLAPPYWRIERIDAATVERAAVERWLAQLAGHADPALLAAGLPDEQLAAWREHGAVLRNGDSVLHIGGAVRVAQVWGLPLPDPDRRSLVRRLGIVEAGRLLATVHLGCVLHPDVRARFAALRTLGARRIAVFTEDATECPAAALLELGADEVVSRNRRAQARWLDAAVERGERVALVHTGLRDLLPPGGLSLCPIDAEAGAHGVLLGEPLAALLAARETARDVRATLRSHFGRSVTLNAALMVAAARDVLPPLVTASLRHALIFLLLRQSAALAHTRAAPSMSLGGCAQVNSLQEEAHVSR
jgi:Zn2+/Cd2+-exporting ATPase